MQMNFKKGPRSTPRPTSDTRYYPYPNYPYYYPYYWYHSWHPWYYNYWDYDTYDYDWDYDHDYDYDWDHHHDYDWDNNHKQKGIKPKGKPRMSRGPKPPQFPFGAPSARAINRPPPPPPMPPRM